jgi:hypothetical protein
MVRAFEGMRALFGGGVSAGLHGDFAADRLA